MYEYEHVSFIHVEKWFTCSFIDVWRCNFASWKDLMISHLFFFLNKLDAKLFFFSLFEKKHIAVFRVVDLWIWHIALLRLCYI